MGQFFLNLTHFGPYFLEFLNMYYLSNFRETQKIAVELSADITKQTGTVKPSGESITAYAEKTLEQKSRLDEVDLPPHSSGRKLQVPILPNTFSCNM